MDVLSVPLNEDSLNVFRNMIKKNRRGVVAIGECGIDHEKQREGLGSEVSASELRKMQVKWFEAQIELAIEFDLPVLLHQRGGYEDCVQTLAKYKHKNLKLIVNCFNGTPEEMKGYIDVSKDCYFVVTGLVCHEERGRSLRTSVKFIPLERLLIATDAPHLIPHNMPPPQPRRCEPGFLSHVLVFLSELLGMPFEELARITTNNARKVYNLPSPLYNGETTRGELVFNEFQKEEDNALKAPKNIKVPPTVIPLEENQHVFELKMEDGSLVAYIVNEKEKSIMEKQKAQKTAAQLVELAETIELKTIPPNSKLCKGETEIYSTVAVKPKKVPEKKAPKKRTAPKRRNKPRK
uniref:TatD related DNase n=1 Tax=Arcella intermedia TaxID=1963864 RepID=A0A6B2L616_9EUKA